MKINRFLSLLVILSLILSIGSVTAFAGENAPVRSADSVTAVKTQDVTIGAKVKTKLYSAKLKYSTMSYTGKKKTQNNTTVVKAKVNGKLRTLKRGKITG